MEVPKSQRGAARAVTHRPAQGEEATVPSASARAGTDPGVGSQVAAGRGQVAAPPKRSATHPGVAARAASTTGRASSGASLARAGTHPGVGPRTASTSPPQQTGGADVDAAPPEPAGPRVSLRRVVTTDRDHIWEWTFSSDLRALMQPPVVLFKDYERWFFAQLADRQSILWIIEHEGARAGVALVDRHDKQSLPRLVMVIAPRVRGRGVGRRALVLLCQQWQRPLIGEVPLSNVAAVRAFEAAGFVRADDRDDDRTDGAKACTFLWSP